MQFVSFLIPFLMNWRICLKFQLLLIFSGRHLPPFLWIFHQKNDPQTVQLKVQSGKKKVRSSVGKKKKCYIHTLRITVSYLASPKSKHRHSLLGLVLHITLQQGYQQHQQAVKHTATLSPFDHCSVHITTPLPSK